MVSLALLGLDPPGALGTTAVTGPGGSEKGPAPAVLNIASFLSRFSPGSSDKIDKRNDKMKRRGSSNGGRRNFETWKKIPQPSPTEKQKLDVVSHSALLSSSPGTPAGPPKQPSSLRALGRGLGRAVHQQPSRKKHAKRTLRSRGQKERKDAAELPSSPIPSWPSGERNKIPKQSNQHRSEGVCPPPLPFLGEPHPCLGPELH